MNVKDLLRGIVVVVDDEIGKEDSGIEKIISEFENDNFPIVKYKTIPSNEIVNSLSSASVIILDWDFQQNLGIEREPGEPIIMPEGTSLDILPLLSKLLEKLFVPVFIFTNQSLEGVIAKLKDKNLGNQINKRIFIKKKNELVGNKLYNEIRKWLKNNPSAYVVKEWDRIAIKNRDSMFLDFYNSDADWVPILWEALSKDTDNLNTNNELGEFITKNFCNRFHTYNFEEKCTKGNIENANGLFKILKHDAFIEYDKNKLPNISYVGDIIDDGNGVFLLNIRAQCDISRKRKKKNRRIYNPELYFIKGVAESTNKNIIKDIISINQEGSLIIGNKPPVSIKQIIEEGYEKYNADIFKCINDKHCFYYGTLLERKDMVLLPYIKENKVFKFNINEIEIRKFKQIKDKRIGRIVPPYLTRIQQKTANYITRQGLMPIPEEIYFS